MTDAETVDYDGRTYRLWDGRVLLDWHTRPVAHHRAGCRLCCTVRVSRPGGPPRHPDTCDQCGPGYRGPRPDPCWLCQATAHLRDNHGRPVHKTCLEAALTRELRTRRDAA